MAKALVSRTARVLIIEPSSAVRQLLSDVAKCLGFRDHGTAANCKDALGMLEFEDFNWVITPAMLDDSVNALQLLKLFTEDSRLRQIRMSLIVDDSEEFCLPRAFELGLLSYHKKAYVRDLMEGELRGLIEKIDAYNGSSTLASADYVHKYLLQSKQYRPFKAFVERLLKLLPGSPEVLLKLAESQFVTHEPSKGFGTLLQIEHLYDSYKPRLDELSQRYLGNKNSIDGSGVHGQNALGVHRCVVIDPDTDVQRKLKDFLSYAGVPEVAIFDNGETAWEYCKQEQTIDLVVQEWRIPRVSGPQLLQRLRQCGRYDLPIVVISSLIKKDETPLVREMGVSAVIAKPFDKFTFFKELVWTLQQNVCPTEQKSFEQKIRMLLKVNKIEEAESILTEYLELAHVSEGSKKQMLAEMAFAKEKYKAARSHAVEALKLSGDSLMMLNLLGKCFMKLGEFESALKCMEKAQSISPHNVERLCNIAEVQFDLGQREAAKEALSSASSLDSGNDIVIETDAEIALLMGDSNRAKGLMAQLDSLPNIVSFMNNRAVALTRCGQFDEGIQLYQDTLIALPDPWSETHDIVVYNLGLAYVRHGDIDGAIEQLDRVKSSDETALGKKRSSLRKRLVSAKSAGEVVKLRASDAKKVCSEPEVQEEIEAETEGAAGAEELTALKGSAGAHPGELCCYLVYKCSADEESATNKFLENMPRFGSRKALQKEI